MAFNDYYDEKHDYAEPEEFLDDVESAWTGRGNSSSGRSGEYLGFIGEEDGSLGFVDWYLFLRTDEWEDQDEMSGYWANIDVTVGVTVPRPETMFDDYFDDISNITSSGFGRTPDSVGYAEGGGYVGETPSDYSKVQTIYLEWYGVGDKISASADDSWNPEKVASALSKQVEAAIKEAEAVQSKAQQYIQEAEDLHDEVLANGVEL